MSGYSSQEEFVATRRGSSVGEPRVKEVYIRSRQHSRDSYAAAPRRPYSPEFYEYERGRSVSTTRSSERRPSEHEGRVVQYQSRSESVVRQSSPAGRGRATTREKSTSRSVSRRPCSTNCHNGGALVPRAASVPPSSSSSSSMVASSTIVQTGHGHGHGHGHDQDGEDLMTPSDKEREKKKARNRQILYTGLAAITTIAAANNVVQSTKASKARRAAVATGQMCEAEARHQRNKAIALDLFSVGVAAIGVNNAVNGWKKMDAVRQQNERTKLRFEQKSGMRKEQLLLTHRPAAAH